MSDVRVLVLLLLSLAAPGCEPERPFDRPRAEAPTAFTRSASDGTVLRVLDGDSLIVRTSDGERLEVRLAAVDAPERHQPFAGVSRRQLAGMLRGEMVTLEIRDIDRYGRAVAVVRHGTSDAGLEMLLEGAAWHYDAYAKDQPPAEREQYAQAEREARAARRGLWRESSPQPPWEFRRQRR